MATRTLLLAQLVFCCCSVPGSLVGQERPIEDGPPSLTIVHEDTFDSDSTANYQTDGQVTWKPARLGLTEGSAIEFALDSGPWVRVSLELETPKSAKDRSLHVSFALKFESRCTIEFEEKTNAQNELTRTISLTSTIVDEDGRPQKELIRQQSGMDSFDHCDIEYRHGLVVIKSGDSVLFMGNGSITGQDVDRVTVACPANEQTLTKLSFSRSQRIEPPLDRAKLIQIVGAGRKIEKLFSQGRFQEVLTVNQELLEIVKSTYGTHHPKYINSLQAINWIKIRLGDFEQARSGYEEILKRILELYGNKHPEYAEALNAVGTFYCQLGLFRDAEASLVRSLNLRLAVLGENHIDVVQSLSNLGRLYDLLGDYEAATNSYRRAQRILKNVDSDQSETASYFIGNNLGVLLVKTGDYAEASLLLQNAIDASRAMRGDNHPQYATALNNLASVYIRTGDFDRAYDLQVQSLEILANSVGRENLEYISGLTNLAFLAQKQGRFERAEELFDESENLKREKIGEVHPLFALSLQNKANLFIEMERNEEAEALFLRARDIYSQTVGAESVDHALCNNNLGVLYSKLGRFEQAERIAEQSLAVRSRVFGPEHVDTLESIATLGELHFRRGEFEGASLRFGEAVVTHRRMLDRNAVLQSARQQMRNQAIARHALDNYLSIQMLQPSKGPSEVINRVWQWKGATSVRQQAYREASKSGQLAPLFQELRSVTRQLSFYSGNPPKPPASTNADGKAAYEQRVLAWKRRVKQLTETREQLERKIASLSEDFRVIQTPPTVHRVQRWLPTGTAFVDFLEYTHSSLDEEARGKIERERRFLAFVIRADRNPRMIGLGGARDVARKIRQFREPYVDGDVTNPEAARQLRESLWTPIEDHLDDIDTIVVSPDTVLGTLPFAALPGRTADTHLIEDYRIAVVPMASQLSRETTATDGVRPASRGLLVVGDVDYDRRSDSTKVETSSYLAGSRSPGGTSSRLRSLGATTFSSLPGFRTEFDIVRGLFEEAFPESAIQSLGGEKATENAFLESAARAGVLHVITHGYFADPNVRSIQQVQPGAESSGQAIASDPFIRTYLPSLLSGLALSGANNRPATLQEADDGILKAADIEASTLRGVDLVVLSACETGLGPVAGGEGLTGLQRAFHLAGARSVIASLWKVDDRATQELMRRFYTNLWIKKQSKIDALRNAQLWILRHANELETMGVDGATRGSVRNRRKPTNAPQDEKARTDPFFWAAFQLSGDWQ